MKAIVETEKEPRMELQDVTVGDRFAVLSLTQSMRNVPVGEGGG
jgi:hypothetical protein